MPSKYAILILPCFLAGACSQDNQQHTQQILNSEFIKTYHYVTNHHKVTEDMSEHFETMKKTNIDAFTSITYRWHELAINRCDLSDSTNSQSQHSGYEKLFAENNTQMQFTEVAREEDRQCLADIYLAYWDKINKMFTFNFPNIN